MSEEEMAKALAEEFLSDMTAIADGMVELYERHTRYGPQFEKLLPAEFRKSWEKDIEKQIGRMAALKAKGGA